MNLITKKHKIKNFTERNQIKVEKSLKDSESQSSKWRESWRPESNLQCKIPKKFGDIGAGSI
jgi:hypothetical protein